jgi:oxygen-independent coproporphyrinogen-3 oxidase
MSTLPTSLVLAERAVPRYTSYPTAPHFGPAVDGTLAAAWLADLPRTATLSLYVHVPYCRTICTYCGCHTKAVRREEPLDAYVETVEREIANLAAATRARKVTHIHWGGGTPSLLGPERLRRLAGRIGEAFDLSAMREHAIELDPRTVGRELVAALAGIGINRASLGVQDMNLKVQEAIGRVQPYETVVDCVTMLRDAGISAVNLDLMYGLPFQGLAEVRRTAELAAGLSPSRLAIFGYAHVPWFKVHQRLIDAATLPGAAERIAQANAARETLEGFGYETIGLDHFARPDDPMAVAARNGTLRRNFQGYTTDSADALLGLGPSSVGRLPEGYVQNASDNGGWRRAVEAGSIPVTRGVAFSGEDLARAAVIERLMCDFAVDFGAISRTMLGDATAMDDAAEELDGLAQQGVLVRDGRRITLTLEGRPFMRLAAAAFDAYLHAGAARHSAAV